MKKILTYILYSFILAIILALWALTVMALEINWRDPVYLIITIVLWTCILCIIELLVDGALDLK